MTSRSEPDVITAPMHEVLDAIESLDLDAPWSEVAPALRLVLPRRREMPVDARDMPIQVFPPGIPVGLGLDIGPAMLFVIHEQLSAWGVAADEAFEQALDNVRSSVGARRHFALVHERVGDIPTVAFQSREGWASSLLLLPDELTRVFGERDGVILAPMRDLVLRLPLGTDRGFVHWLLDESAAIDMNALDVPILVLDDGALRPAVEVPVPPQGGALVH